MNVRGQGRKLRINDRLMSALTVTLNEFRKSFIDEPVLEDRSKFIKE